MSEAGNCVERATLATVKAGSGMMRDEQTWKNEVKHFVTVIICRT